jgi:hypothetical protein
MKVRIQEAQNIRIRICNTALLHPNIFTSVCVYGSIVGERGIAFFRSLQILLWKTCSVVHKFAEVSKGRMFGQKLANRRHNDCLMVDR